MPVRPPLFNTALPEEAKEFFREKLFKRFDFLQDTLARQDYLTGAAFSVVDAYLFTVLGWCKFFAIDLGRWPALPAYMQRVGARPAVQAALRAEAVQPVDCGEERTASMCARHGLSRPSLNQPHPSILPVGVNK